MEIEFKRQKKKLFLSEKLVAEKKSTAEEDLAQVFSTLIRLPT